MCNIRLGWHWGSALVRYCVQCEALFKDCQGKHHPHDRLASCSLTSSPVTSSTRHLPTGDDIAVGHATARRASSSRIFSRLIWRWGIFRRSDKTVKTVGHGGSHGLYSIKFSSNIGLWDLMKDCFLQNMTSSFPWS